MQLPFSFGFKCNNFISHEYFFYNSQISEGQLKATRISYGT